MKPIRLLTTILCAALLLSGCAKEENLDGPETTGGPSVRLTLGGSAVSGTKAVTRGSGDDSNPTTHPAEEAEKSVADLRAVLFSTKNGFYKTIEAIPDGSGNYTFIVEKDDTYDVWLVANADETLRTALESIPAGTNADNAVNGLGAIIASQASDADNAFLMLSTKAERVTTQISETKNIGEIHMRRLSVRVDIVNAADGIEVTKVTFNNRTKQSYLQTPNIMPTEADWFENKEYTPAGLVGNSTTPTEYLHEIYSYENYTQKGGTTLPTLTLEYTEDGQSKTHTVEFIDANAPAGTPLALKRNYLYRITLSKAYELKFNLEVVDWEEGETFEVPDLPLDGESQAALNAKLKVNMFTEYNVKSADLTAKTIVSFYDQLAVSLNDCPTDSYFTYTQLQEAGLTGNGDDAVLTDGKGNKYRLPTEGELNLLLPMYTEKDDMPDIDGKKGRYYPYWPSSNTTYVMVTDEFTETIYLKNGADNFPDKTTNAAETDGDYRLVGTSQLKVGAQTEQVTYSDNQGTSVHNIAPVYGIRFKGTSQYAAYRWESCQIAGNPLERYLSIKIKALPADSEMTVDDLVGNNSFWAEGCIEFKFPGSGYYKGVEPNTENDNITYRGINGYCWSSSLYDVHARNTVFGLDDACVAMGAFSLRYSLRLVRVQE